VDTGQIRLGTTQDLADLSRLCDMFPKLERRYQMITPQNVPAGSRDLHCWATMMLNSASLWPMCVYSSEMVPYFIELQTVYEGSLELVKQNPQFVAACYIISPFQMAEDNIRMGMLARELLGQPLWLSHIPIAGTATPVTIAGALVQSTVELFMGNTVTLALDDCLGMSLGMPGTTDMRTGFSVESGPDVALSWLASAQMRSYIMGGEYATLMAVHSNAQTPGAQSVMDRTLAVVHGLLNGARSFVCLGSLASCDVASPVQLLLDLELMAAVERYAAGVVVDDEHLAEDVIREVGPTGGRYLEHEHTARHCREVFTPELMDLRVASAWLQDPRTMLENATAKARQLIAEAPNRCPLSDDQRREISRILAAADARVLLSLRKSPVVSQN
jgi:trimethylamine--corrinoid protein Co-methyltransferase